MEETVGRWWHESLMRLTTNANAAHAVSLEDVRASIGILFRAAGGDHTVRLAESSPQRIGGERPWLHRLAGVGERAALPVLESNVLAAPAVVAVFADSTLNRDLYLWWALLAAQVEPGENWLYANVAATQQALAAFPGFIPRYRALCAAQLAARAPLESLSAQHQGIERWVQQALRASLADAATDLSIAPAPLVNPDKISPVWLWLWLEPSGEGVGARSPQKEQARRGGGKSDKTTQRRRATRTAFEQQRHAFILPFRSESLATWSEFIKVNRSTDDEDDGNAQKAADDMDQLAVTDGDGQTLASRVKFDLDLPSSSVDDTPLGEGQPLPEWDYRKGVLLANHCMVQEQRSKDKMPFIPSAALKRTAQQLRRRLEVLNSAPRVQFGQTSGDGIDLDAWVRLQAEWRVADALHSDSPAVYTRQARGERSMATLLLADLSQSTDAHATDHTRVIDVIRDALYVFGEGLTAVGDPFAMWGFSSVRRSHVRMQLLKRFEEPWGSVVATRVGAIRPGYYTRMGAALRHATAQLQARPERKRLLLLLTDGKPNDLDIYEGRYGLEDTRHAVHEARLAGLTPFCVTIDAHAHDYLPYLFGRQGFCLVHRPQDLMQRLTAAWSALAR